jgi:hypothetical protein
MIIIDKPGIYLDVPTADYFSDPCFFPSLTQSVAKILLDRFPKKAWLAHPRLNPAWEPFEHKKFAIGNAAHSLMMGRGKELAVFDEADWNATGGGKGAKKELHELRDEALAQGKVPILKHQHDTAVDMVVSARTQLLTIPDLTDAFIEGNGEVVIAAEVDGVWLRSMVDWMVDPCHLYDYKTTDLCAAPERIPYIMANAGWDVQAAIQERILDVINPAGAGRRHHYFVCQETDEPYAMVPSELPESVMNIGRRKLTAAMQIWRSCMTTGDWPLYSRKVQSPAYPAYAEARWEEKLMGGGEGW